MARGLAGAFFLDQRSRPRPENPASPGFSVRVAVDDRQIGALLSRRLNCSFSTDCAAASFANSTAPTVLTCGGP